MTLLCAAVVGGAQPLPPVPAAPTGNEAPHALTPTGLRNLVAFAHLLGYIQHFHPSDEAQAANWHVVAIDGATVMESASNASELAARLQDFFRLLAPTVQVFPTSQRTESFPSLMSADAFPTATRLLIVRHLSVPPASKDGVSVRERIDIRKASPFPAEMQKLMQKPLSLPNPDRPWEANLGAGVSCRVPLAVYADDQGTLPHTNFRPYSRSISQPDGFVPNGSDRATRLAGVILAWNEMQHFYPYFDTIKQDWGRQLECALMQAATDADSNAYTQTLRRLLAGLQDGHGVVISPDEAPVYYPAARWDWIENHLVIIRVGKDEKSGLRPGDVVVKVEDIPAREALRRKEDGVSGATMAYRRRAAMVLLAGGKQDTEMRLVVQSQRGRRRQITLQRTLLFADFRALQSEPRPAPITELRPGLWYVDIDRSRLAEFQQALPQLEHAKGIIFDVRGYPRLSLTAPLEYLTDVPLKSPPILLPLVLVPDRRQMTFLEGMGLVIPSTAPRLTGKIVFLTDMRAISAAETFLAIVQHYGLGTIVGTTTAGTNGNVRVVSLPGGYSLQFTGLKVLNYDGSRHHGRGIAPDIEIKRTRKGAAAEQDEILQYAIQRIVTCNEYVNSQY